MLSNELIPNEDFFSTFKEAILIVSDKYNFIYINAAFTNLTGFKTQDLIELSSLCDRLKRDKLETTTLFKSHIEFAFSKKDGALLKLRVSESNIILSDLSKGRLFTFILLPGVDIIPEGEKKFYELADASPAMIFIEDVFEQAFYFNKAWLDFTGKKQSELINTKWKSLVHPHDLKTLDEQIALIIKKKSYSCDYRLMKYDGTYRNLFVIGTPVILEDGSFAGYMSSCLDITEIKETQNKITLLTQELKLANEELEQFTYVTSHDLQEPLRMITGYVQLIQKNIEKGNRDTINEFMAFVLNGTARMQMLIADLLQLSRVNRKAIPFAPVDLKEVLHVAIAHLVKEIKNSQAEIDCGPMPIVQGDTFQLVSLFENLLGNAIKFKSLQRLPLITISADEKEEKYIFQVKDNGIGIDNKFHKRIFAIFQRLHTQGEYEGTGIGLAVCKKIVERHGGEIWVESEPEKGSSFYFTIKK